MKKFLSIILCVLILCATFPLSVLADEIGYDTVSEVTELREENVKHFLNPDGSYTALAYSKPVHRLDENGNWQDLENIMSEETRGNKQAYITSDGRTVFSKKINSTDNEIFTLNDGKYSISVSITNEGVKNTTAKLSNHAKKYNPSKFDKIETQYKKLKEIDTTTTLLYKNALSGIDLEYVLSVNDIKENIIVRKLQNEYSYSFIYELNGLLPELEKDGSISLKDKETLEKVYNLPAPYMFDNSGETSQDVEYILIDKGNDTYEIKVVANAEWINSPERELPVVIDPTTVSMGRCDDTYVDSNASNSPLGNQTVMYASSTQVSFMKPYLIELPSNATITQALLNLYYYFPNSNAETSVVRVFPMTVDWSEDTLTWYLANSYQNMGIDYNGILNAAVCVNYPGISSTSPEIAVTDITYLYQNAYAGKPYYGFAMDVYSGDKVAILTSENLYTYSYCEITYNRDALVENGEYFIGNANDDGFVIDLYLENSINVSVLDGSIEQKWNFEYLHNGYYKITSSSNLVLSIPELRIDTSGISPTLETDNYEYRKQWKIVNVGNGMYNIIPRMNETRFALSTDSSGTSVQQLAFQTSDNDEWFLFKVGTDAFLLSILDPGHDHHTVLGRVSNEISSLGFDSFNFVATNGVTDEFVLNAMENSRIFVSRSHGNIDADGSYILTSVDRRCWVDAIDIYDFFKDEALVDLSNSELMLFVGCKTAAHSTQNLPIAAVNAGAEVAVGFTETITCYIANLWTEKFFEYYSQGYSVEASCEYAVDCCVSTYNDTGNLDTYVIVRAEE